MGDVLRFQTTERTVRKAAAPKRDRDDPAELVILPAICKSALIEPPCDVAALDDWYFR